MGIVPDAGRARSCQAKRIRRRIRKEAKNEKESRCLRWMEGRGGVVGLPTRGKTKRLQREEITIKNGVTKTLRSLRESLRWLELKEKIGIDWKVKTKKKEPSTSD